MEQKEDQRQIKNESSGNNPLRWLYNWVLSWADTPYGEAALFVLAFTEASFFPIPPDVLLIALVLGARKKALRLGTICTVGSVLGAVAGFGIGFFFWESTRGFFFSYIIEREAFEQVRNLYDRNLFLIVFSAAFSPIPFKVFTIASGVFADGQTGMVLSWFFLIFLTASLVGRGIRFYLISYLLYRFGKPIRNWIESYFNLLTLLGVLLLALLLVLTRWF